MRYPFGPHCTKTPEMSRQQKIASFDPSGVGLKNGHFIGLPFGEEDAQIVLLPVGWDVTVSYMAGTSTGPLNILDASSQLDLYDPDLPDAWKVGIYMRHHDLFITNRNEELRPLAERYIDYLEDGGKPENSLEMAAPVVWQKLASDFVRFCSNVSPLTHPSTGWVDKATV